MMYWSGSGVVSVPTGNITIDRSQTSFNAT